jgi:hypothetical protein
MNSLRYGIAAKTATCWSLYAAREEGLYTADGLEVEAVVTGGTLETFDTLRDERIELACYSPDELIAADQWGDRSRRRTRDHRPVGLLDHRPARPDLPYGHPRASQRRQPDPGQRLDVPPGRPARRRPGTR